jgi:hypothetical protein
LEKIITCFNEIVAVGNTVQYKKKMGRRRLFIFTRKPSEANVTPLRCVEFDIFYVFNKGQARDQLSPMHVYQTKSFFFTGLYSRGYAFFGHSLLYITANIQYVTTIYALLVKRKKKFIFKTNSFVTKCIKQIIEK